MRRRSRPRLLRHLLILGGGITLLAASCLGPLHAAKSASAALDNQTPDVGTVAVVAGIPARMMAAYSRAAAATPRIAPKCRGMRWQILAGIAKIESNHAAGRHIAANGDITPRILGPRLDGSGVGGNTSAMPDTDHGRLDGDARSERAVGPFQFLPATWAGVGQDGNGDGRKDPHNADDAALGAAGYLCGAGRNLADTGQLRAAIYFYNHSDAYVADVLRWIRQYSQAAPLSLAGMEGRAAKVLGAALEQRGVPYSWAAGGAGGPSFGRCCSPSGQDGSHVYGFDCSGLTAYAFAQAGVRLPRSAAAQAGAGRRIPASAGTGALQPGDLVLFGYEPTEDATVHHVGIYLGHGQMINALRPGTKVRIDLITDLPDYAGGARVL